MNFSNLQSLTIPEGIVKSIMINNQLVWEKQTQPEVTYTFNTPTALTYEDGEMVLYGAGETVTTSRIIVNRIEDFTNPWLYHLDSGMVFANDSFVKKVTSKGYINFDENVTTVRQWFFNCEQLEEVNITIDMAGISILDDMFALCPKLQRATITLLNSSDLTDISYMFNGDEALESVDLSIDTQNVEYMAYMFKGCRNLKTIYVTDSWVTDSLETQYSMFEGCVSLVGDIPFDSNCVDGTYATYTNGYLTLKETV